MVGASRYIHIPLYSLDTIAGPRLLTGFIDAPVTGLINERTQFNGQCSQFSSKVAFLLKESSETQTRLKYKCFHLDHFGLNPRSIFVTILCRLMWARISVIKTFWNELKL